MIDWIRFGISAAFIIAGLIILSIATYGVFKFKFALNRIHSASMMDTLALILFVLAFAVYKGFTPVTVKILLVLCFQWFTSPIATHMLAKAEYKTDPHLCEHCSADRLD